MSNAPETVTIVFTDLVGSTATRTSLGEEDADELGRIHFELLADAVTRSSGRIVKGTGDGVLAVFGSAVDALDAAVAMQQVTDAYGDRADAIAPMEIRVGISTGDITWDSNDDIAGTPAVEAARLEGAAEGGQILCADLTKLIARGRGGHVFVEVGELELKGLDGPVAASEVLWERVGAGADIALPQALRHAPDRFVGRDAERELLRTALALESDPSLTVLVGEPGIGKTTLAALAAREAHQAGRVVLFGRCDRQLTAPYQPFIDALETWARAIGPERLNNVLMPEDAILGRLSPTIASALPITTDRAPHIEQLALFDAVRRWASQVRPVLVIDDLQWATDPTVLLLRVLVLDASGSGATLIATVRDSDVPASVQSCLEDAVQHGRAVVTELTGLDAEDLKTLTGIADTSALHARTGGNPLFVEALGGGEGGATIEAAVARRVQTVNEAVRDVLRLAAVVGLDFSPSILSAILDLDELRVLELLEAAEGAALVTERGLDHFSFSHGLVQEALSLEISETRRARLHGRIALAIETVDPTRVAELAHHYDAAGVAPKAIEYLTLAAAEADLLAAHGDSVRLHERVAELHPDEVARLRHRTLALGSRAHLGKWERSRIDQLNAIATRAKELGEDELVIMAGSDMAWMGVIAGPNRVDINRVRTLLDVDTFADPFHRLRASATLALNLGIESGNYDEGRRILDAEAHLVDAAADPVSAAWFHHAYCWTADRPEDIDVRIASGMRGADLMEAAGDPLQATSTRWLVAAALLERGDLGAARANLDRGLHFLANSRHALHDHLLNSLDVCLMHANGDFLPALEVLEANHAQVSDIGEFDTDGIYGAQKFMILRELGRLEEIAGPMQLIAEIDPEGAAAWRPGLAALFAELGMAEAARREVDHLLEPGTDRLDTDNRRLTTLSFVADAVVASGATEYVDEMVARLSPWADLHVSMTGISFFGPTARYLGRLCRLDADTGGAERWFRRAVDLAVTTPTPPYEARSRLDLADLLVMLGRRDEARDHARRAAELAHELGMPTVLRRALDL